MMAGSEDKEKSLMQCILIKSLMIVFLLAGSLVKAMAVRIVMLMNMAEMAIATYTPVAEAIARSSLTASSSASLSAIKTVLTIVVIFNDSDHHDGNHNHDKYDHDNHPFSDSHRDCSALLSPTTASPSR